MAFGDIEEIPVRKRRSLRRVSQVDPDQATRLADRIGARAKPVFKPRVGNVRSLEHGTVDGEFPAMIDAADSAFLYPAEQQRCAAVAAMFGERSKGALGVAEHAEAFAANFDRKRDRSEEHTSELQSLMRISYAVFCLKKKNTITQRKNNDNNDSKKPGM